MRRILFYFDLATLVVWMIVIFFLSSQSGLSSAHSFEWGFYLERKGAHFFEYFILTALAFRTFRRFPLHKYHALNVAFLLAFAYAVSDELHQFLVPGREARMTDVAIDTVGIFLSYVFFRLKK